MADDGSVELYETDSDRIVAFLGTMGFDGMLLLTNGEWAFHPIGSVVWDAFHQQVYRMHHAMQVDVKELEERNIPMPPLERYRGRPGLKWEDNFPSQVPLSSVADVVRRCLRRDWTTAYVVLVEDTYETSLGDGRFLFPAAAFFEGDSAVCFVAAREAEVASDPAGAAYDRHSLKLIRLRIDEDTLYANLALEPREHVQLLRVLELLASSTA